MPRVTRRDAVSAVVALPWLLWAVVRALGLDLGHPLVAAIGATPLAAASSPVPVVVAFALRARLVGVAALAAAVTLAAAVLPRAVEGSQRAAADAPGVPLVVMTANLYLGRADAGAVVRTARANRVDVLSVQELTAEALRRLDAAGARTLLPGRVLQSRDGAGGSGLLARSTLSPAPQAGDGEGHAQPSALLRVPGARDVRITAVHPVPPISAGRVRIWRRQLRSLPAPAADGPWSILAGDFNATLDHRELRRLLDRGLYDAADATGAGLRPTWPVGRRLPPLTLDHVVLPAGVTVRRLAVHEIPGSDHRAVVAEVLLPAEPAGRR
ncbi:MAG TPA: endonuclease/exonuclease/phosphatase family protein [Solirubrobacteraceae bacterium]|nr:endonuclease/exonuclease/phosphatase family protein [Solirubrobacteraceae bacterium]